MSDEMNDRVCVVLVALSVLMVALLTAGVLERDSACKDECWPEQARVIDGECRCADEDARKHREGE